MGRPAELGTGEARRADRIRERQFYRGRLDRGALRNVGRGPRPGSARRPANRRRRCVEVLVQFFEGRQTEPIFNFPLRDKHCFPYLQDHGHRASDLRCVELSFFDFVCQLDSTQRYFRIPKYLESKHWITSLLHLPVILLNQVIQVLVGPDERLSGQDAFGLQFGDGLMGRLIAVERDLLRNLIITDRLLEEAYGGRFIPVLSQQEIYSLALLIDRAVEIAPLTFHFDIGFIDSPG